MVSIGWCNGRARLAFGIGAGGRAGREGGMRLGARAVGKAGGRPRPAWLRSRTCVCGAGAAGTVAGPPRPAPSEDYHSSRHGAPPPTRPGQTLSAAGVCSRHLRTQPPCAHPALHLPTEALRPAWGCGSGGRPGGAGPRGATPRGLPQAQVGADKGQQVGAPAGGRGRSVPIAGPATLRRPRTRSPWQPYTV